MAHDPLADKGVAASSDETIDLQACPALWLSSKILIQAVLEFVRALG